jgi:hypothetical protein
MAKKILIILTTALCCVSCVENRFRENDVFVVKGVEISENIKKVYNYKHRYYLFWLQKYNGYDKTVVEEIYFYSDEKYELGDTLRFIITKDIKNGK